MKWCILIALGSAALGLLTVAGCNKADSDAAAKEVVLYFSIDEPYVRPLLARFEKETGIHVRFVTDAEATKTAGLVERFAAERDHPQADVYWGNEVFHTINLADQGLFTPYRPARSGEIEPAWRGEGDLYTCTGLRARFIAVSTVPANAQAIQSVHGLADLTAPALKGKIGICNPGLGTASGHFAALYIAWGEPRYTQWCQALHANGAVLLGGNSVVADQVAAGNLIAGLTDNDDVNNAKAQNDPLDGFPPDQGPGGQGTLLLPASIALVKGGPHEANGKRLMDFLCSAEVEKELLAGHYYAYSVRDSSGVKSMSVDYVQAAHEMKHAVELALTILQER